MEITEVRVKLVEDSDDRLQAFCSITFDNSFVVRDLKIIEGNNGPFVAMPSRKRTSHCPRCRCKNHTRASYCNQSGNKLKHPSLQESTDGRSKLYADIAHPINSVSREMIQSGVLKEYKAELARSKKPGYSSRYGEGFSSGNVQPHGPHLDHVKQPLKPERINTQTENNSFGDGIFDC